jgi:hypothetical protein
MLQMGRGSLIIFTFFTYKKSNIKDQNILSLSLSLSLSIYIYIYIMVQLNSISCINIKEQR